ncbi:hypothetical protein IW261DRAFT_1557886 [Armillaria novae-zelandiae]|uniref:Uncharacterized protein n=1 Tax=Armillaria novae-zelandiae TaxID=153914 RepID=A0AA39PSK4_9AGAR|nr:hypothetical protein IW261DRAFT_1557886 [Armillaria novae-zelandiae]
MYPELPPPRIGKRRRQQLREPLIRPPPPLPFLAPPISQNRYAGSFNSTSSGWGTDSNEELHEELRRLRGMISNSNVSSQGPKPLQGAAHWAPDVDSSSYDVTILRQTESHAEAPNSFHFASSHGTPMEVDATPDASSKNGAIEDEFEFKDKASKAWSNYEGRRKEIDAYNVPMRPPTLPLTPQQQQQLAMPLNQIPEYSGPLGMPNVDVSFETSLLRPSWKRRKSLARRVNTQDSSLVKPPAKKRKRSRQPVAESEQYQVNMHGEEKKPKLELPEPPTLQSLTSSADNQHGSSSAMTKPPRDNATLSYRFPQIHDGQTNLVAQHYNVDKQVEGVASPPDAVTRGPMELRHSVSGTSNDTSSICTLSSTQSSSGPADFTETVRSFRPQTELLNPCAKINEFILNTHPHANVAITHSGEWSSALSQGDDSDVLLRVLSDYMVIVRNGVAILEAR